MDKTAIGIGEILWDLLPGGKLRLAHGADGA